MVEESFTRQGLTGGKFCKVSFRYWRKGKQLLHPALLGLSSIDVLEGWPFILFAEISLLLFTATTALSTLLDSPLHTFSLFPHIFFSPPFHLVQEFPFFLLLLHCLYSMSSHALGASLQCVWHHPTYKFDVSSTLIWQNKRESKSWPVTGRVKLFQPIIVLHLRSHLSIQPMIREIPATEVWFTPCYCQKRKGMEGRGSVLSWNTCSQLLKCGLYPGVVRKRRKGGSILCWYFRKVELHSMWSNL